MTINHTPARKGEGARPMLMQLPQIRLLVIVAGASAATVGCGRGSYRMAAVTGTVTCAGQPAEGGLIVFTPMDAPEKTGREPGQPGPASTATIRADGSFVLVRSAVADQEETEGALIGPHQVRFNLPRTTPYEVHPEDKVNLSPEELKKLEAEIAAKPIYKPLDCGSQITPNVVEVQPGTNHFEFTLQPIEGASARAQPRQSFPRSAPRGGPR